jgi:hypothetical protein
MSKILDYERCLNTWVDCLGIDPKLPDETLVEVLFKCGAKAKEQYDELEWGYFSQGDYDDYMVIRYRIFSL